MSQKEKKRKRWLKVTLVVAAVIVALLATAVVILRVGFHGEELADLVEDELNSRIRGEVSVGSVEWDLSDLPGAIVGGWLPVRLRDVKLYDSKGKDKKLLLESDYITAEIDGHAGAFGRHDLIVRDLSLPEGGWALIEQVGEPNPVHEFDTHVVSLLLSFRAPRKPSFSAGISARPRPIISVENVDIVGADLHFEFPEFSAIARNAQVHDGLLYFDGTDPLARRLVFQVAPTAEKGTFTSGPVSLDLADLVVEKLEQIPGGKWPNNEMPRDLVYKATATSADGAELDIDGRIRDYWNDFFGGDHEVDLRIENGAGLAGRLTEGMAGGDDLSIHINVDGPKIGPKISVHVEQLDLAIPFSKQKDPLDLHLERATATFDLATESGSIEDTVARGAGGSVVLNARFALRPWSVDAYVDIPEAIEVRPFVPPELARHTGTKLSGHLHAIGNRDGQRIDNLDLKLGRARVTGGLSRTRDGLVEARDLTVALGGTTLQKIQGRIDIEDREVDVRFGVVSTDVRKWLRLAGAAPVATRVSGHAQVTGGFDDIYARGTLTAGGVPILNRLEAELSYRNDMVTVHEAQTSAFDGWVRGSGKLALGGTPRLVDVEAQAVNVKLSRLPVVGWLLDGRADATGKASGPLSNPEAEVNADLSSVTFGGEQYRDTTVQITAKNGVKSLSAHLDRANGGKLDFNARIDARGGLGGAISLRDLPLSSLTELAGVSSNVVGGDVAAEIQLSGTPEAPTADGYLSVARSYFRQAFFGGAELEFERVEDGVIQIHGQLMQGRVNIDGQISTRAPFVTELSATLRRVELDQLKPELADRLGARGWISGQVRWRGPLLSKPNERPSITAELTEAILVVDSENAAGRPAPIRLRAKNGLSLAYDGVEVSLLETAQIVGPAGTFSLSGSASPSKLGFEIKGKIAANMLAPYFRDLFEGLDGSLDVKVQIAGTPKDVQIDGVITIEDIAIKPIGQEAIVSIPRGIITLKNDSLGLTGVDIEVIDEFSDEQASLSIGGGIGIKNLRPTSWALRLEGDLAGKMLLVVAPQIFSAATGKARISVALGGMGQIPDIDGSIDFERDPDAPQDELYSPLTITPRGLRREIALNGGRLLFTGDLIELESVAGTIDDEGQITDLSGDISLVDWSPESVDVTVSTRDLPFRVPQTLDMSVTVRNLRIVGGRYGLQIEGTAEIVDGRYIRKWRPFLDALKQIRTTETSVPIWESVPLLANADLNIRLDVRSFYVRNNMAKIDLTGAVRITNTPADPRFEGVVRVEQGSFKFQGIRAKFARTAGTVTFSPYKEFPEDTPLLDIQSESDYRDINGQDHLIVLTLSGPISNLDWDLSTSAGLNKAQTFTLIFSGRTPEEARQALLGDEAIGRRPGDFAGERTTASRENTIAQATDELVKDLAGDFFSLLIEDPIKNFTTLDVARLEIGSQLSVGFHGEKVFTDSLRAVGDVERSLRGWTWDIRGQYRVTDNWSLNAERLSKRFDDDAEEDEDKTSVKLTWRKVVIP